MGALRSGALAQQRICVCGLRDQWQISHRAVSFLTRCGMGFGGVCLGAVLRDAGLLASDAKRRSPPGSPFIAAIAALPGQGEARHPPVHERRAVAGRHVRPQADARRSTPARRCPAEPAAPSARPGRRCRRRSSSRSTARAASRSASCFPHVGRAHRRHLRHPLDARRRAQPRAVAAADELRRGPADPAEHGLVGDLRPGHREPEPARLHRHVPRRLSDPGDRRTGRPASCPASTRARTSTRSTPTSRS